MPRRSHEKHTFLVDVLTTFAEYPYSWFRVYGYRWYDPELSGGLALPSPEGWANAYCKVVTDAGEGEPLRCNVTVETIAKGFARLRKGPVPGLNEDTRRGLCWAYRENDGGALDVNDADVVLQVALFDEVVYS